jgi:hypothetical protein
MKMLKLLTALLSLTAACAAAQTNAPGLWLNWIYTPVSNSLPLIGFNVQRSFDGTNFTTIAVTPGKEGLTSYRDTPLVAGSNYCYRVNAWHASDTSEWSNVECALLPAPRPKLARPVLRVTQ